MYELINQWKLWRTETAKKGQKKLFVPDYDHPELKENTDCLIGIDSDNHHFSLSPYIFPALMSHNLISVQPVDENSFNICGRNNPTEYSVNRIHFDNLSQIKLGRISNHYFNQITAASTAVYGWDQFVLGRIEEMAETKIYMLSIWNGIVDHVKRLKNNIEDNSGLPVTWIVMNRHMLASLEQDEKFIPLEDQKYVSGSLLGRWDGACVYGVENTPKDAIALMGYKGNNPFDSSLVLGINRVIYFREGTKSNSMFGFGEIIAGCDDACRSIGKLLIN